MPPSPSVTSLVVGAAADDRRLEHVDGVVVEGATEGAGRVDVDVGADEGGNVADDLDAGVGRREGLDGSGVDVGDDDLGAVLDEVAREDPADLADAGDADATSREGGRTPQVLGCGPHALEDPERGEDGGVAGAALLGGATGGEAGRLGDDVHVLHVGAHVARRDVAAAEALDEPAEGTEQARGSCPCWGRR